MEVKYSREQNQWAVICFCAGIIIGILSFLPALEAGWNVPVLIRIILVIFIFCCGVFNAKEAIICRNERRRIAHEGVSCDGVITEVKWYDSRNNDINGGAIFFIVRYNSRLLGKEIVFETPAVAITVDGYPKNIKCTVIEAKRSPEFEKKFGTTILKIVGEEINWKPDEINHSSITALVNRIVV